MIPLEGRGMIMVLSSKVLYHPHGNLRQPRVRRPHDDKENVYVGEQSTVINAKSTELTAYVNPHLRPGDFQQGQLAIRDEL
jgi:hypothetical protein